MLKVNNKDTRTIIVLSFFITFERISHIFLLMTLNKEIFCLVPPYQLINVEILGEIATYKRRIWIHSSCS